MHRKTICLMTIRAVESEARHPTPTPGNFDYPTPSRS